jgi:hypothetical protein
MIIRITLFATRQEPASLEGPQGRTAGPALQPALRLFHRGVALTARPSGFQLTVFAVRPMIIRITLFATRQEPASLEGPQGRTAGPALQAALRLFHRAVVLDGAAVQG